MKPAFLSKSGEGVLSCHAIAIVFVKDSLTRMLTSIEKNLTRNEENA
jgi:hypothetical protein